MPGPILAVDVGGSHVKILLSEGGDGLRRFDSGPELTPQETVAGVVALSGGWQYDRVSVGVPAPVRRGQVVTEPVNLGPGWIGFDFEDAFGKPTKVFNDAAMQALGSYDGDTMLFLGLGTGLGSALIVDGVVAPMELAHLPFRRGTFEDYVGERGRKRLGKKRWRAAVLETIDRLSAALEPDYVVLGGGNAKKLDHLPDGVRLGTNENAFLGAFRLWDPTMASLKRVQLPPVVGRFLDTSNARDVDSFVACFAPDAVVEDEGRTHTGIDAVRSWKQESDRFTYTIEPRVLEERDGRTVLEATLAGDFPGSPVEQTYEFTIRADGAISALRIH